MNSGCGEIPYIIDLDKAAEAARKAGAKRIVLQLPDGLKLYATTLARCLQQRLPETRVYVHMDHNYGACDLQYGQLYATLRPDLIVHVGHSPYPGDLSPTVEPPSEWGVRIVYVKALSRAEVRREHVAEAAEALRRRGVARVAVATTSQHTHRVRQVAEWLRDEGLEVAVPRGISPYFLDAQTLGCDYRLPRSVRADGFLYLGGGVFHPLGLYLSTLKPVVKLDPYEGRVTDLTGEGEKLYRNRLYRVMEAFEARRWGLIVGLKTGQYRPWLVDRLASLIAGQGGEYMLLASENLSRDTLVAVDNDWFQAFVVTSCPRLPTDDYWDYHKPVLTPGEARMALERRLEPYQFPW